MPVVKHSAVHLQRTAEFEWRGRLAESRKFIAGVHSARFFRSKIGSSKNTHRSTRALAESRSNVRCVPKFCGSIGTDTRPRVVASERI
jgi:hypothetical protein